MILPESKEYYYDSCTGIKTGHTTPAGNCLVASSSKNGIDLIIEDSYETCREFVDNGINAILMTTKMNKDIDNGEIPRVNTWDEIYTEIEKIKKEKENKKRIIYC